MDLHVWDSLRFSFGLQLLSPADPGTVNAPHESNQRLSLALKKVCKWSPESGEFPFYSGTLFSLIKGVWRGGLFSFPFLLHFSLLTLQLFIARRALDVLDLSPPWPPPKPIPSPPVSPLTHPSALSLQAGLSHPLLSSYTLSLSPMPGVTSLSLLFPHPHRLPSLTLEVLSLSLSLCLYLSLSLCLSASLSAPLSLSLHLSSCRPLRLPSPPLIPLPPALFPSRSSIPSPSSHLPPHTPYALNKP